MSHLFLSPEQAKFIDDTRNRAVRSGLGARYLHSMLRRAEKLEEL